VECGDDFIGGQVINLVGEDGTVLPVKDFVWDTGTELRDLHQQRLGASRQRHVEAPCHGQRRVDEASVMCGR
jgi:hypothetical protein